MRQENEETANNINFTRWTISSWVTIPFDTTPYWNIYYCKVIRNSGKHFSEKTGGREIEKLKKTLFGS